MSTSKNMEEGGKIQGEDREEELGGEENWEGSGGESPSGRDELAHLREEKEVVEMQLLRVNNCWMEDVLKVTKLEEELKRLRNRLQRSDRKREEMEERLKKAVEGEKENKRVLGSNLGENVGGANKGGGDGEAKLKKEQDMVADLQRRLRLAEEREALLQGRLQREAVTRKQYLVNWDQASEKVKALERKLKEAEKVNAEQRKGLEAARTKNKRLRQKLRARPKAAAAAAKIPPTGVTRHGRNELKRDHGYFCECSPKKYPSQQTLSTHLLRMAGIWKYTCGSCPLRFRSERNLKCHWKKCHGEIPSWWKRACKQCGKVFTSLPKLFRHFRTIHMVRWSKRVLQERNNGTERETEPTMPILRREVKIGSAAGDLNVAGPSSVFPEGLRVYTFSNGDEQDVTKDQLPPYSPSSLASNVSDRHKKFSCNLCKGKFVSVPALQLHQVSYHQVKIPHLRKNIHGCQVCGEILTSEKFLREHRWLAHPSPNAQIPRDAPSPQQERRTSSAVSTSTAAADPQRDSTRRSQRIGSRPVPGPSKTAEKKEGRNGDMLVVDLTERPHVTLHEFNPRRAGFHCKCRQGFSNAAELEEHITASAEKRWYTCNFCSRRFRIPQRFQEHMRRRHNITFNIHNNCKKCQRSFHTSKQVHLHELACHTPKFSQEDGDVKHTPAGSSATVEPAIPGPSSQGRS